MPEEACQWLNAQRSQITIYYSSYKNTNSSGMTLFLNKDSMQIYN